MMKVLIFRAREEELDLFRQCAAKYEMTLDFEKDHLSLDNVHKTRGYDGISIVGNCRMDEAVASELEKNGIRYATIRAKGYNNVDVEALKRHGIRMSNVDYSPYGVSNFSVMLMLMLIRRVNYSLMRTRAMDYSLKGNMGLEMQNLTVGVLGTGNIGAAVIQHLQGFGCKILAHTPHPKEALKKYVTYVSLEELLKKSDIVTLHMALTEDNHHIIDKDAIAMMKEGSMIVNAARGGLVDTEALIEGLLSGKLGGAALDTFEREASVIHADKGYKGIDHKDVLLLQSMPNVIITQHVAFYTDQSIHDIIDGGLGGLQSFYDHRENLQEITR